MKTPKARDHAEEIALFRSQIVGGLTHRELNHGELIAALKELSQVPRRAPQSKLTRRYSLSTLERWYYTYKKHGISGLEPQGRCDRGRARDLTDEQRKLLSDVRTENPHASVALILRTLEIEGRVTKGDVSESTVRRFYKEQGLCRANARQPGESRQRLRWEAAYPGALFHADVCHYMPGVVIDGVRKPVRIHGILDDASRYVVALEAMHTEQEVDMLKLLAKVVQGEGPPEALYLDNGSTYRGETLSLACHRMGITLLHARPYDPEARGKMERFNRTMRQGCLDHLGPMSSLHDLNVRLWAWLDQHYHKAAHGGLLGRSPDVVWKEGQQRRAPMDQEKLRDAFVVKERRRVRKDSTLDVSGQTYELDRGHLARQMVHACWCELDAPIEPWVEAQDRRFSMRLVDAKANAKRKRAIISEPKVSEKTVAFDPAGALLDRASGRTSGGKK